MANTGDVIKTLTKAKKNMKREKYGNKRKHLGRICHPNSQKCSLCRFPLLTFSLKLSLVLFNIFVLKLEKIWTFDGKVTRCLQRRGEGHSGTPRQLTTGSATVSDLTHDLNVKMAGMI